MFWSTGPPMSGSTAAVAWSGPGFASRTLPPSGGSPSGSPPPPARGGGEPLGEPPDGGSVREANPGPLQATAAVDPDIGGPVDQNIGHLGVGQQLLERARTYQLGAQ